MTDSRHSTLHPAVLKRDDVMERPDWRFTPTPKNWRVSGTTTAGL
ncbi:hypothetical protein O9992_17295 [Vibrio lentus]|nr:hypothetical protein [Vibrio lentus]